MDQSEIVAFLSSAQAFRAAGDQIPADAEVEIVETHGAYVFLCGDVAFKLKRAVIYDYMDLGTVERRHTMLLRELDLNAPTAPMIYRDVLPVTQQPDGLALGGDGPVVDWVLRMWRFPAEDEFEALVARGAFDDDLPSATGEAIAAYHGAAPVIHREGGRLIADILAELGRVFAEYPGEEGTERVAEWREASAAALCDVQLLLDQRGADGHVRRGHGDLHLRNLVLIEGRPVLFDALEFDETLGTCDVLYDVGFLVMDLCHRGLPQQACRVLDAWLREARGAEDAGLAALPLFLSVRAAIRAMVLLQTDKARSQQGASAASVRALLDLACHALSPAPPQLIAVGGYSGTGKSILARHLAPGLGADPGAVLLSSDLERKVGLPKDRPLGADHYSPKDREAVYRRFFQRAETVLSAGHAAILDATFLDAGLRQVAGDLARRTGVPFHGFWLDAPQAVLEARVLTRYGGPSDADISVLRCQLERPIGVLDWHRLDASNTPEATLRAARDAMLRSQAGRRLHERSYDPTS